MLKSHKPEIHCKAIITDKDGNVYCSRKITEIVPGRRQEDFISLTRKKGEQVIGRKEIPFRSFVDNFVRSFYVNMNKTGNSVDSIRRTSGDWNAMFYDYDYWNTNGGTGDVTRGIIVGGSDRIPSFTDYTLGSAINHGNSEGQLSYSGMTYENTSAGVKTKRTVFNNSGATVNIKEIGLFGFYVYSYMLARDVKDYEGNVLNIALAHGESLEITYNFNTDGFFVK